MRSNKPPKRLVLLALKSIFLSLHQSPSTLDTEQKFQRYTGGYSQRRVNRVILFRHTPYLEPTLLPVSACHSIMQCEPHLLLNFVKFLSFVLGLSSAVCEGVRS